MLTVKLVLLENRVINDAFRHAGETIEVSDVVSRDFIKHGIAKRPEEVAEKVVDKKKVEKASTKHYEKAVEYLE